MKNRHRTQYAPSFDELLRDLWRAHIEPYLGSAAWVLVIAAIDINYALITIAAIAVLLGSMR